MSNPVGLDILNDNTAVDLTQVRTAMPILKPATSLCILKSAELEANKKQTGSNLNIQLTTVNPTETVDGKVVNPGFTLFDTISLVRTFKDDGTTISYDPVPRLVEIIEAITGEKNGTATPRQMVEQIQTSIGQQVAVRHKVESSDQYGDKTRVQRYIKSA
jgi:hypothetical protein